MSDQSKESEMGRAVWQAQALEAPRLTMEYVRHQAEKLNADLHRESRLGYVGVFLCAAALVHVLWNPNEIEGPMATILRVAAVLLVCAGVYVLAQVRRRGRVLKSEHTLIRQSLDSYRMELERRRDLYWKSWRWSAWPFVPSALLVFVGGLLFDQRPNKLLRYTLVAVFVIGWTALALWLYKRRGDAFHRELVALDSMKSGSTDIS
jgi:hypothetical protein